LSSKNNPNRGSSGPEFLSTPPLVMPIYQSAAYIQKDVDQIDRVYENHEPDGYTYGREGHPNAVHLAENLAQLETAEQAVICGSGMAATACAFSVLLKQNDTVVASDQIYGRTAILLDEYLRRFGVTTHFVDITDLSAVETALRCSPRILFFEMISNPLLRVANAPALIQMAHAQGSLAVVDNTFPTPVAFRPLEHGADLVVQSVTKMIAGHSDVTLGAVLGSQSWIEMMQHGMATWGLSASPFECWLAQRGLATLSLRMERSSGNAQQLADYLDTFSGIKHVIYPGRKDHPDCDAARVLFDPCYGNMVSFELAGGRQSVDHLIRNLDQIPLVPTLGHIETIISHPASTSHRSLTVKRRSELGISDTLLRVSVGCEAIETLEQRFRSALQERGKTGVN